jgi:diguanylate cyclase (GGDEF)-like protein/putative nucleotidyltransferase with HDIG domain/PAS domain S-box-containing protein
LLGESVVTSMYFGISDSENHKSALVAISASIAVVALVAAFLVTRIAALAWRESFSLGAILLSGVVLTVEMALDGGLSSPLTIFVALPVIGAALALGTVPVVICATAALVEVATVAAMHIGSERASGDLLMLGAFLVGLFALTIGNVVSRSRLQRDEEGLLQEVERLAQTDPLTGCFNHGAFYEKLDAEINRTLRGEQNVSLLVVDIDFFKGYNDSHGHGAGDRALAAVASAISGSIRSFDTAARVGDDEFAVILPATSERRAEEVATRISVEVAGSVGLGLTVSVGFASLDRREPTSKRLFRDADLGLYRAKANGRNCVASLSENDGRAVANLDPGQPADLATAEADRERMRKSLVVANQQTVEATSILDAIESNQTVGIGFVDRDFRILRINSMLAAVNGGRVEEQIGRKLSEVVPEIWSRVEPFYRAVLYGAPVASREVYGETAADPGNQHYWLLSLYPVVVSGETIGIGLVLVDITDRKLHEQGQAQLSRAVVSALAGSVEMRDPYTAGHQDRVAKIAVAIATEMGLGGTEIESIELAARIHDLGKLSVPAEILSRPGKLSPAEMDVVRGHSQAGFDLLRKVGFPRDVSEMVLQHHERLDGSGYPLGLSGDEISAGARIIAVADVLEAMASHRPYRSARGVDLAFAELERGSGTLYDPCAVGTCKSLWKDGRLPFEDNF